MRSCPSCSACRRAACAPVPMPRSPRSRPSAPPRSARTAPWPTGSSASRTTARPRGRASPSPACRPGTPGRARSPTACPRSTARRSPRSRSRRATTSPPPRAPRRRRRRSPPAGRAAPGRCATPPPPPAPRRPASAPTPRPRQAAARAPRAPPPPTLRRAAGGGLVAAQLAPRRARAARRRGARGRRRAVPRLPRRRRRRHRRVRAAPPPRRPRPRRPQVVNEVALKGNGNKAQGLMRVFKGNNGGLVFALAADKMPANKATGGLRRLVHQEGRRAAQPRLLPVPGRQERRLHHRRPAAGPGDAVRQVARRLRHDRRRPRLRHEREREEARPGRALGHAARRPGLAAPLPCGVVPRLPENLDVLRDGRLPAAARRRGDLVVRRPDGHGRARLRGAGDRRVGVLDRHRARRRARAAAGVPAARRRGRRPRVAAGDHGRAPTSSRLVTQGMLAALVIAGTAEVWSIALLAGLTRHGVGVLQPGLDRPAARDRGPERLQQANGVRATAMSAGEIGGPVLAGVLVAAVGAGLGARGRRGHVRRAARCCSPGARPARTRRRAATSFWRTCARAGRSSAAPRGCGASWCGRRSRTCLGRVERARAGRGRERPRRRGGMGRDQRRARRRRAARRPRRDPPDAAAPAAPRGRR